MSGEASQRKTVNRAATVRPAAAPVVQRRAMPTPVLVQTLSKVSSPKDPAEKEAEVTAKKIMRMAEPESSTASRPLQSPYVARFAGSGVFARQRETEGIQRQGEGQPNLSANTATDIRNSMSGGSPLPPSVRGFMEPRFRADFSKVRVHTGERAARLSTQVSAQAFTVGSHVFFGRGRFQPESSQGRELIAHELTHTIQQGGAVQRSEDAAVTQQSPEQVQRLGVSDALDYFADKANLIPGFRMFTIILGVNPINMRSVERSAANILRAVVEFIPGGGLITQALDNYGIFDRVGTWVDQQIRTLGMTGGAIRAAVMRFVDSLSWTDIFDLGGVWERAKSIFSGPIDQIKRFLVGLGTGILRFIKDAILRPLASLAEGTQGYDLLKAVLGEDPITGDPVPRNADTLIGGFMKLIGQEEVWNNLKKANAVARAWAWFQGALGELLGFVRQIPGLFVRALQELEIADIVVLPRAFLRVGRAFAGFIGRFISWAGSKVLDLLQIIFEVLAPRAVPYLRRAAGAFRTIIQNPIGFVGNLIRAGLQGFRQFGANFLNHLRTSLIQWLTGALSGASIYIPQALNLREIIKFVLSVLGLTWQDIRQRLVRVAGETAVRALETGFDIVVTLVTQGPAAAWEKIQESLTNLREMVMEQIMTFVRDRIVQAAITRLVTSLNPAGAFIQAIIAIYNTIMFFVERLQQIMQVAMSFIDSIAAIASGAIGAAANRVEQTMAGGLTLVISFLARQVGLGNVGEAVRNVVNVVRAPIGRALDRVVDWIWAQARRLGRAVVQAVRGQDTRTPEEKQRDLARAVRELQPRVRDLFRRGPPGRLLGLRLAVWKLQYRLTELRVEPTGAIVAAINPTAIVDQLVALDRQRALATICDEIERYLGSQESRSATASAVMQTGSGTRAQPFDPRVAGSPLLGVQAVLSTPGAAPRETSWIVGTHRGEPVTAILQRPNVPRSAGQGEVFAFDPATGRRVAIGAYPRTSEVPGVRPATPATGPTAAGVISGTFGGSGSRAAGYAEEQLREGRTGGIVTAREAHMAGAVTLLGAVETVRNPLAAVTIPSALEQSIRSGTPGAAPAPLAATLGGPHAAAGSARDWRLGQHALSAFDPVTGAERTPTIASPFPRGVRTPERSGSVTRAAGLLNASVESVAESVLAGIITDDRVLVLNLGDLDRIREQTREFLVQRYGRSR